MKRHILYLLSALLLGVLLLLLGVYLGYRHIYVPPIFVDKNSTEMQKLSETVRIIENNYVDTVSTDSILQKLIPEIFSKLDPHSYYLTAKQNKEQEESMQGEFYGIGITFNNIIDTVVIVSCIDDGPSDLAGLKAGDRILFADSLDLRGADLKADSIRNILKGLHGSMVKLHIYRPETKENIKLSVKRDVVNVSSIDSYFVLKDSLGYIKIKSFTGKTYGEFVTAAVSLLNDGAKAFIIDLRNNPGGLMQAAMAMANEFLKRKELIVYTEGRKFKRELFFADGTGKLKHQPVYVLINQYSASSSELFSGALQDNDRGIIIGRRSFGKGLVQKVFQYRDGASVVMTIARYHTPSGRCIQKAYDRENLSGYVGEVYDRSRTGEWFVKDSIHPDLQRVYHTAAGRIVYGGGGIIPDVFIPQDTVGISSYFREVFAKNLLLRFAFKYVDDNRALFENFKGMEKAVNYLDNQALLSNFISYARRNGVKPRPFFINKSRGLILEHLYAHILSFAYGEKEASKLIVKTDPEVLKAVALYEDKITSPLLMNTDIKEDTLSMGTELSQTER